MTPGGPGRARGPQGARCDRPHGRRRRSSGGQRRVYVSVWSPPSAPTTRTVSAPAGASYSRRAPFRRAGLADAGLRPIAVAGTHGKTTTTSMLAVALSELGLDPSYAIGGDLEAPGTNADARRGRHLRRRGRRERPQLPQVRPRGRDRPQRRAGPPRELRLDGRDLRVLRDVRRKIRPGGTLVVSADQSGAGELTGASPAVTTQNRHVRRVRGRRRTRPQGHPARSDQRGHGRPERQLPHLHGLRPRPPLRPQRGRRAGRGSPSASRRTTSPPRSASTPASSAASSSRARRPACRSSTRTRTTPPR